MLLIKEALVKLDRAVTNLEGSLGNLAQTLEGQQRDMFGAPERAPVAEGLVTEMVVQKLDETIERVEKMLEDA